MVARRIPLPLDSEAAALLGLPLGDAVVLMASVSVAAILITHGGWDQWPEALTIAGLAVITLFRWEHDPIWFWIMVSVQFAIEPRHYVAEYEDEVSHHAFTHETALSLASHRRRLVSDGSRPIYRRHGSIADRVRIEK